MRLICPHCMSGVTVSDDMAGKDATCPNCGKSFPTPPRYEAAVVPEAAAVAGSLTPARSPAPVPEPSVPVSSQTPPPPPGFVPPPAPSGFLPPETRAADVPTLAGYTRSMGFTISPKVVAWLPAVFLTLAFLLTFFPWTGTYLGSYPVYSQGPWRAVRGKPANDPAMEAVAPPGTVGWADKVQSDWLLMVPFLLCLILATALAWADRALQTVDPQRLPPPVQKVWPFRLGIIAGLSVAAVALVVIQSLSGFGLERAVRQVVRENPALVKEREAAGTDRQKLVAVEQKEELELWRFNLNRTAWMHFAVVCTALGALSVVCYMALEKRGNKPPPRVVMHY